MLFHPAIIALLLGSFLVSLMLLYACYYGVWILRRWDIRSGSELQLNLERRTYLISTTMTYAFCFQILSLFLFIYTADRLSGLLVGAMCAAGALYANPFGYPAFILKLINLLFAGLWLVINYTDNRAHDYPLIKKKYGLLLFMTPLIIAETIVQANYFFGLKPDIITSCCGALFTSGESGLTLEGVSFPAVSTGIVFYSTMALTFLLGSYFLLSGKAGYLFSLSSLITFFISIIAFLSFICLYFYEIPTHHCPFCILQKEYGYIGYPIYFTFLAGGLSGLGGGGIMAF